MDQTVKVYASNGGHSDKTWGRIMTNRIIDTASDDPEIIKRVQKEKHRIEALLASYIPTIKKEAVEAAAKEAE